ncbi:acid-sensing ion channel 3 [Nephila pilipes]|uniref:Acid-sensing ion channel 3 n=1 Tax=Nephila pilipes TaxID=299642 RepID=A0A8X6NFB8_NEPPI|nr:acid-sensing ion channel 3 [Nephila pilipes]
MKEFGLSSGTPLLLSEGSSSFYCNAANHSERDEIKESLQQYYEMDEEWRWRKGHKPSRFMQKCLFRGRICPQNRLSYFQNLRYGNCITFNKRKEEMKALTVSDVGPNTGLILELKLESVTYHPSTKALGARVVIHHPNETPSPEDQGFIEISVSLRQSIMYRLPTPFRDHCVYCERRHGTSVNNQKDYVRSGIKNRKFLQMWLH